MTSLRSSCTTLRWWCCSVAQSCPTLCDPKEGSAALQASLVLHCLPEFAQIHVHWVGDAIQPSYLLSPSLPVLNRRDGWMASLTRWTWVWVSSGSWWWTGKPGVLQSMGLQRIVHDWATELIVNFGHCIQLYSHHPIEIQSHSLTSRSPPPLPSPSLPPDMCPNSLPQETTFLCFDTIAFLFLQFYLKGVIWYSYSRLTFT